MENERMTGAELATMRQACGLSREELAQLCDVQPRTVKHWESGRAGVPADVAQTVRELFERVNSELARVVNEIRDGVHSYARGVTLMRFRSDADMELCRPELRMPVSSHGLVITGALHYLAMSGIVFHVVWFDPADYERWRQDAGQADSKATRQAWAAGQVAAQAMPHKGDQPAG